MKYGHISENKKGAVSCIQGTGFEKMAEDGTALIEDFFHGKPYTDWGVLWKYKFLAWSFFFFGTVCRDLVLRRLKRHKVLFMDISDFLLWFYIGFAWLYSAKKGDIVGDPNPIWVYKDLLRFGAVYLNLALMFFNWYWPPLALLTYLSIVMSRFEELLPGYADLYVFTWVGILFTVTLFSFFFEKSKRDNFTIEYEGLQKERVWKEILNEFPEGVLILNKRKEVVYVNHAVFNLLNIETTVEFERVSEINSIIDINIENFSTESFSFFENDEEPAPNKFKDLQEMIYKRWDALVRHYESPSPHHDYMMFKGTYFFEDQKSKTIDMKFTMRTFGSEKVALFLFSDISERLIIDSLKQTIQYKERLLATVSHELRTPLNGNINFVNCAIQDVRVPQIIKEKLLIPALRSARYLLTLINDILDFSQAQNRTLRLVFVAKNVVETLKDALELVEIQAKKKGIALKLELPYEGWDAEIKTDHGRLQQILLNLLSNALKFTTQGSITVRAKIESNKVIRFEVEDTGIGIKEEDKPKLFHAFGKVDLATTSNLNPYGVGLGLMISNTLAQMLGPKTEINIENILSSEQENKDTFTNGIKFESVYGKGSKFYFSIEDKNGGNLKSPYVMIPMEGERMSEIPEFAIQKGLDFTKKPFGCHCAQILIADDDAFNILTLENILGSMNLKCDVAYNGKQALDLLISRVDYPCCEDCKPYTAIFLDCNMPVMDGFEGARKIREVFSRAPNYRCPVIACTAHSEDAEIGKALEAGMTDFVTKPLSKNKVKDILAKHSRPSEKFDVENL